VMTTQYKKTFSKIPILADKSEVIEYLIYKVSSNFREPEEIIIR
jgi:hypothetical protein